MSVPPADPRQAEADLLAKAKAGDFQAFADLCEPCRKSVCSYLAGAGLADPADAEDVFMDAILRARKALDAFQGGSSFSTWLTTIARNLALDRLREAAAHPLASLDAQPDPDSPIPEPKLTSDSAWPTPSAAPIPGESLDTETRAQIVRRALAAIPGKTREAVVLFYVEQRPYAEIAQILDIPIGTVMSRLHNGRKRLEQLLRPHLKDLR